MKKCELIHVGEKEGINMKIRHAKLSETKKSYKDAVTWGKRELKIIEKKKD